MSFAIESGVQSPKPHCLKKEKKSKYSKHLFALFIKCISGKDLLLEKSGTERMPCTVGAWQLWASTLILSSKCHPGWAPRPAITVLIRQRHSATFQHTSSRTKPWKKLKLTLKTVVTILIICEAQCTRNLTLFKHLTYISFL